jgi:hypothetical protein
MIRSFPARIVVFLLLVGLCSTAVLTGAVPAQISDEQFWKMVTDFSESDGYFRSENLLSNELYFQWVLSDLTRQAKQEQVYLGVGPEQNFTYIAALKPRLAIIFDIRRGNLNLQLMYKAIFELSKDRADFVSRLFSRKQPEGLTAQSSIDAIFDAVQNVSPSRELYAENLKAIKDHLITRHGFGLSQGDLQGIEYVYDNFYTFGPNITYNNSQGGGRVGGTFVSYANLMTATDQNLQTRSFLATEENFAFLKDLQTRNLVLPVVGDFSGPKAIRTVANYLKSIDATVSAFYLSNVEDYLTGGKWDEFCRNSSNLPLDEFSTFIRSNRLGHYSPAGAGGLNLDLGNMLEDLKGCASTLR